MLGFLRGREKAAPAPVEMVSVVSPLLRYDVGAQVGFLKQADRQAEAVTCLIDLSRNPADLNRMAPLILTFLNAPETTRSLQKRVLNLFLTHADDPDRAGPLFHLFESLLGRADVKTEAGYALIKALYYFVQNRAHPATSGASLKYSVDPVSFSRTRESSLIASKPLRGWIRLGPRVREDDTEA